jgi:hypothetical protein
MGDQGVRFCVHVDAAEDIYGVTLFTDDGNLTDESIVNCIRVAFQGEAGLDVTTIAGQFAQEHQEAMDHVGLEGVVAITKYNQLLDKSVELACVYMEQHGLIPISFADLPVETTVALFGHALPDDDDVGYNTPGSSALN